MGGAEEGLVTQCIIDESCVGALMVSGESSDGFNGEGQHGIVRTVPR